MSDMSNVVKGENCEFDFYVCNFDGGKTPIRPVSHLSLSEAVRELYRQFKENPPEYTTALGVSYYKPNPELAKHGGDIDLFHVRDGAAKILDDYKTDPVLPTEPLIKNAISVLERETENLKPSVLTAGVASKFDFCVYSLNPDEYDPCKLSDKYHLSLNDAISEFTKRHGMLSENQNTYIAVNFYDKDANFHDPEKLISSCVLAKHTNGEPVIMVDDYKSNEYAQQEGLIKNNAISIIAEHTANISNTYNALDIFNFSTDFNEIEEELNRAGIVAILQINKQLSSTLYVCEDDVERTRTLLDSFNVNNSTRVSYKLEDLELTIGQVKEEIAYAKEVDTWYDIYETFVSNNAVFDIEYADCSTEIMHEVNKTLVIDLMTEYCIAKSEIAAVSPKAAELIAEVGDKEYQKYRVDFINDNGATKYRSYFCFESEEAAKQWANAVKPTAYAEVLPVKTFEKGKSQPDREQ